MNSIHVDLIIVSCIHVLNYLIQNDGSLILAQCQKNWSCLWHYWV